MLSAEVAPYAKVGGLADVAGSLPLALAAAGHEVVVAMPRYGAIDPVRFALDPPMRGLMVTLGWGTSHGFGFFTGRMGADDLPDAARPRIILADNTLLFGAPQVYGLPYEHERFFFFCRAALQWCTENGWQPDIVHCHDWHTAIAIHWLRYALQWDRFWDGTATVFTIHNLAYQGVFGGDYLFGLADVNGTQMLPIEYARFGGAANPMARGIVEADIVNTVSPTYHDEVRTPESGEGLDTILRERGDAFGGILNGINEAVWNPATDPAIAAHYDAENHAAKAENKAALQRDLGLDSDPRAPVIGVVARLVEQKGFDLVATIADRIVDQGAQLVVLGSGDPAIEDAFRLVATERPQRVAVRLGFDARQASRIYAGSDLFLMPSRFEPCGLGQMIAMRYGTIPIVRRTGGLADTVTDYDPLARTGTGFVFDSYDAEACFAAVARALEVYRDPAAWDVLIANAMARDFSWAASARQYTALYRRAAAQHHSGV
ncbi:MAG: glycogen synthase [Thermomicrobia bacterium]|nr:glycogen synthase [Thermomicrobia bacterium]